jgi:hypothetical protein
METDWSAFEAEAFARTGLDFRGRLRGPDGAAWEETVRRLVGRIAEDAGAVAEARSPALLATAPSPHAGASVLRVAACDYRIPLARLRAEGSEGAPAGECGCSAVCLAGRSRRPDGLVGDECRFCPLSGPVAG